MTFYLYTFDGILSRLHLNRPDFGIFTAFIDSFVANKGNFEEKRLCGSVWREVGGRRNGEIAALVRHAAVEQGRIDGIEQGYVGIGDGLPRFVDNRAYVARVGLLNALHEDFPSVIVVGCADADRVKSYHLTDGIGHGLSVDRGGDAEVLQLVVEEVDGVVRLLDGQLAQGVGNGLILIFSGDALLRNSHAHRQMADDEQ